MITLGYIFNNWIWAIVRLSVLILSEFDVKLILLENIFISFLPKCLRLIVNCIKLFSPCNGNCILIEKWFDTLTHEIGQKIVALAMT